MYIEFFGIILIFEARLITWSPQTSLCVIIERRSFDQECFTLLINEFDQVMTILNPQYQFNNFQKHVTCYIYVWYTYQDWISHEKNKNHAQWLKLLFFKNTTSRSIFTYVMKFRIPQLLWSFEFHIWELLTIANDNDLLIYSYKELYAHYY